MATVWTCLVRIKAGDDDRSHLIEKTSFTIGRTEDADLPLTESSVSRKHLSIEMRGPLIFVKDLNSGNGTSINGQKIETNTAIQITANDVVKVGLAPHEFQITSIPKPFENALSKIEAEKLLQSARKEAETIKTQALIELQTKKQDLETEIASLKSIAIVAASQERMKYAKDADQYMSEAQKKIAQDYENAGLHIESQMQAAQEKSFSMLQDAERRAREAMLEAQDEAMRVRQSATDEARVIHQEALKKHSATLISLQDKFQSDMAARREEISAAAKSDAERECVKIRASHAKDIAALEKQLSVLKTEVGPLQEKRDGLVTELKNLDDITTQARRELERNSKEVDNVRTMLARTEQVKAEKITAEHEFDVVQRKLQDAQTTIDKEIAILRQKALLELENEKKGSVGDLAKTRLRALEDVQRRIQDEEKKYGETLRFRAIELSQRISAKLIPALPELTRDPDLAGARVKEAIEASTRESLMNESSSFVAHTVGDDSGPSKSRSEKSKRNLQVAAGVAVAIVVALSIYGKDIYQASKGSEANSYASQKMEERKVASIYHPENDPRYGTTFRDSYSDNVVFMKGYFDAKTDSLNQQKWLLRLNDLEFLRPKGLTEDDIVAYISKENAMIARLGVLKSKIDGLYAEEGLRTLNQAETDDLAEIKRILKSEANYKTIHALERDFVTQIIR